MDPVWWAEMCDLLMPFMASCFDVVCSVYVYTYAPVGGLLWSSPGIHFSFTLLLLSSDSTKFSGASGTSGNQPNKVAFSERKEKKHTHTHKKKKTHTHRHQSLQARKAKAKNVQSSCPKSQRMWNDLNLWRFCVYHCEMSAVSCTTAMGGRGWFSGLSEMLLRNKGKHCIFCTPDPFTNIILFFLCFDHEKK